MGDKEGRLAYGHVGSPRMADRKREVRRELAPSADRAGIAKREAAPASPPHGRQACCLPAGERGLRKGSRVLSSAIAAGREEVERHRDVPGRFIGALCRCPGCGEIARA